ncbi:MAG: hypothetical protein HYX54_01540 [Chloroflexi bacterium]|nr:hypothetical protein [Chloroflexota bacterium]
MRLVNVSRRGLTGVVLAGFLSLVLALPVFAWQAEGGTLNCGQFIGYVHARYNDIASLTGPGGTTGYYGLDNGTWQVSERNGSYSGDWMAIGDPNLDLPATYAGCRNYGAPSP